MTSQIFELYGNENCTCNHFDPSDEKYSRLDCTFYCSLDKMNDSICHCTGEDPKDHHVACELKFKIDRRKIISYSRHQNKSDLMECVSGNLNGIVEEVDCVVADLPKAEKNIFAQDCSMKLVGGKWGDDFTLEKIPRDILIGAQQQMLLCNHSDVLIHGKGCERAIDLLSISTTYPSVSYTPKQEPHTIENKASAPQFQYFALNSYASALKPGYMDLNSSYARSIEKSINLAQNYTLLVVLSVIAIPMLIYLFMRLKKLLIKNSRKDLVVKVVSEFRDKSNGQHPPVPLFKEKV